MHVLLDTGEVSRGLRRIAGQIVEHNRGTDNLLLVGVRRGGISIMHAIAHWITQLEGVEVPTASVDISLYRDDAATALPNPRIGPSEMPANIDGRNIVLIDDVAYTRRTIRAALDALLDYGRPRNIELAVLIDRAGRELPIQPDYRVRRIETLSQHERIDVFEDSEGLQAIVQNTTAPSIPPKMDGPFLVDGMPPLAAPKP